MNLAALEAQLGALAAPAPHHISPTLADICALLGRPAAEHADAAALVADIAGLCPTPYVSGSHTPCGFGSRS